MLTAEMIPEVEKTPRVCGGEACVVGTRIPVWLLEGFRKEGKSDAEILSYYPGVTRTQLKAAWKYVKHNREEIDQAIRENDEA